MADPFVWFDLRSKDVAKSQAFHEELFGWNVAEVPTGTGTLSMIGAGEPWASVIADGGDLVGWFPYIQVENLKVATDKAEELGATVLQPATEGPAGTYTPIREPGGAVFALFEMRS